MELTIDQALQQGVAAHKEGKPQDAERFYRAILQVQPKHPDANHNLGVLAVSVGKPLEAIPLFKLALSTNPTIEQFWLSYLDVLIALERFDEAKQAFIDGQQSVTDAEKLKVLHQQFQEILSTGAGPSRDQLNHLQEHYHAGRLAEAEACAESLTQEFPRHPFGWKVLAVVFKETGRLSESLILMQRAAELSPHDAETHSNLGAALKELGRLDDAEASLRHAIALQPDHASAHYNLGNTLKELGRLDEAEASFRQAIVLKSDLAEAHYNLGQILKELGRLDEAETSYREAIGLKPDLADAHYSLGNTLKKLDRLGEAEASYRQAVILKPDAGHAVHMLSALTGENTAHAPLDYVENLFDGYAARFDSSLVDQLNYRTPKAIAELITQRSESGSLGSVLDLGCGTGLFGIEISQMSDRLEGLDISRNMLCKAEDTGVYDRLVKQDIESYLLNESFSFNYFVATDVFVYIGDLVNVFQSIQARNKSSGRLVFSVEHKDGQGFALLSSGRYAHSKSYIEDLCERFHYRLEHFETQNLRLEKGSYILGGLYLLSF